MGNFRTLGYTSVEMSYEYIMGETRVYTEEGEVVWVSIPQLFFFSKILEISLLAHLNFDQICRYKTPCNPVTVTKPKDY